MNRIAAFAATLLLFATIAMLPSESCAQKKKAPPKSEQATEQPAPPSTPGQAKLGGTMKDALMKFKGEKTNLGMLTRIESDYFVVEDDGLSTIHPLSAVAGIKILKVEEGEEDATKIEITMLR